MTDRGREDASGDDFDADDWFARAFGAPEPPPVDPAIEGAPHLHDALPPTEAMPFETAHLAEVAPDAADAPAFESLPTQAMEVADIPTPPPTQAMDAAELPSPPAAEPTAVLVPRPLEPPAAPGDAPAGEATSAIDRLFGDDAFREYEPGPDPSQAPWANRPAKSAELVRVPVTVGGGDPPRGGLTRLQKILFGVLGGLLAILALLALFLLGTRLPSILGPAPAVSTPTPSPTPSATALPVGPVEPGEHRWDDLLGGECLDPFEDAWQDEYTVVDCAEPHAAQLVHRGVFPGAEEGAATGDAYPGVEALQAQISLLCNAPGILDLAAAGAYKDAQLEGSFPATEEQWAEDRSFFCFVSRSSGEPLTGSIAVPPAPPAEG